MGKADVHLSIHSELLDIAKNMPNFNISKEFEEWIRIRLNQMPEPKDGQLVQDYDLEIAKFRSEIQKLENKREIRQTEEMKVKEKVMVIDGIIDNEAQYIDANAKWEDIIDKRIHGLQYLFKNKFNEKIEVKDARELLMTRLKERKLID